MGIESFLEAVDLYENKSQLLNNRLMEGLNRRRSCPACGEFTKHVATIDYDDDDDLINVWECLLCMHTSPRIKRKPKRGSPSQVKAIAEISAHLDDSRFTMEISDGFRAGSINIHIIAKDSLRDPGGGVYVGPRGSIKKVWSSGGPLHGDEKTAKGKKAWHLFMDKFGKRR